MRYFNKKTMTECIFGIHEIDDNNVIELPDDHWFFTSEIPPNKQITIDKNGDLALVDTIELISKNDKITINELKKQRLINNANAKIKLLERAIKYNIATDTEKKLLEQLELFTINVDRIDLSDTNVVFPDMPE